MPRGFVENKSTHTHASLYIGERHKRLSFDVDRLLGQSEIMSRDIRKSRRKCIYVFTLMPRGKSRSFRTKQILYFMKLL